MRSGARADGAHRGFFIQVHHDLFTYLSLNAGPLKRKRMSVQEENVTKSAKERRLLTLQQVSMKIQCDITTSRDDTAQRRKQDLRACQEFI